MSARDALSGRTLPHRSPVQAQDPPPTVPALRERTDDVALLAQHFLDVASARFSVPAKTFLPETLRWFDTYRWPGNVSELENLVYREFLLAEGTRSRLLPRGVRSIPPSDSTPETDGLLHLPRGEGPGNCRLREAVSHQVMRRAEEAFRSPRGWSAPSAGISAAC